MGHPVQPDFEGAAGLSVGRRLGAGAFGITYRARDTLLGRDVAL